MASPRPSLSSRSTRTSACQPVTRRTIPSPLHFHEKAGPDGRPPRIVFMGTPEFAVSSLRGLLRARRGGRGRHPAGQAEGPRPGAVGASPVKELALGARRAGAAAREAAHRPSPRSCARSRRTSAWSRPTGRILPPDVLEVPAPGLRQRARLAAAALPGRRAHPVGDRLRGRGDGRLPDGDGRGPGHRAGARLPRLAHRPRRTPAPRCTTSSRKLGGRDCCARSCPRYLRGELQPRPAGHGGRGARADDQEGGRAARLRASRAARARARGCAAFTPWPGAFTHLGGKLLKVHRARVGAGTGAPGTVLAAGPEGIEVACGEGSLVLAGGAARGQAGDERGRVPGRPQAGRAAPRPGRRETPVWRLRRRGI